MIELAKLVKYDPLTGGFVWIKNGLKAGGIDKQSGYYQIVRPNGKVYGHRLAFACMGVDVPPEIDHDDRNRGNNKWDNIKPISHVDNNRNKSLPTNNTSGTIGISWNKQRDKWNAYIVVSRKKKSLGAFVNYSDAVNARKNAEVLYGYHKNHGS